MQARLSRKTFLQAGFATTFATALACSGEDDGSRGGGDGEGDTPDGDGGADPSGTGGSADTSPGGASGGGDASGGSDPGTGGVNGSGGSESNSCPEEVSVLSSGGHQHLITITRTQLEAGEAFSVSVGMASGHSHDDVPISAQEAATIASGGTVTIDRNDGHPHQYVIACES